MNSTRLADSIFVVENFLSKQERFEYMTFSEKLGFEPATINTAAGARLKPSVRNNSRAFYKSEELAQALWERAQVFTPAQVGNSTATGLNELFRFYRYQRGHQFKGHFDESYARSSTEASLFTFMIYLNDNFTGGDTAFRTVRVQPRQGMALLFSHSLFHEGREVTQGVKYVLRTDVMYRLPAE